MSLLDADTIPKFSTKRAVYGKNNKNFFIGHSADTFLLTGSVERWQGDNPESLRIIPHSTVTVWSAPPGDVATQQRCAVVIHITRQRLLWRP
jgi:hypothetical protein